MYPSRTAYSSEEQNLMSHIRKHPPFRVFHAILQSVNRIYFFPNREPVVTSTGEMV